MRRAHDVRVAAPDVGTGARTRTLAAVTRFGSLLLALVLGVLLAGGHLAVLQVVAWAGMIASRSATTSLVEAVETTFDGQHPCSLCQAIRQVHGDAADGKGAPESPPKLLKFTCLIEPLPSPTSSVRVVSRLVAPDPRVAARDRDAPPTPPPTRS
jgi:hypothetical protein